MAVGSYVYYCRAYYLVRGGQMSTEAEAYEETINTLIDQRDALVEAVKILSEGTNKPKLTEIVEKLFTVLEIELE